MTEIATQPASPEQIALAKRAILGDAELERGEVDGEAMSRAIAERIFSAETFEEAFGESSVDSWRDHLERPALVRAFHLNPSGFEQGANVYAVVDLTWLDTDEQATVTVGGRNVLAQLMLMLEKGWMNDPAYAVRMIANRTADGYDALWLRPAEAKGKAKAKAA